MSGYVIQWGDLWAYSLVPVHKIDPRPTADVHVSKEAALNAVIIRMHAEMATLRDALKRAKKKQRTMDMRRAMREPAAPHATGGNVAP